MAQEDIGSRTGFILVGLMDIVLSIKTIPNDYPYTYGIILTSVRFHQRPTSGQDSEGKSLQNN